MIISFNSPEVHLHLNPTLIKILKVKDCHKFFLNNNAL